MQRSAITACIMQPAQQTCRAGQYLLGAFCVTNSLMASKSKQERRALTCTKPSRVSGGGRKRHKRFCKWDRWSRGINSSAIGQRFTFSSVFRPLNPPCSNNLMVPFTTAAHFYRLLAQSFTRWQLNRVQADTADEETPTHRSAPTHRYFCIQLAKEI